MINIYKNNYSFHLFNLLLILNSSLLFSYNCNDNSALNFNQSSNSNIECVYFNIPSLQQTEEDIDYEIDLLSFASGNEDEINNLSFSVDCSNISYIGSCVLSDTYLTVVLIDNYDSTTDVIDLTITYDISDDLLIPIIKSDSFYISVNAINDPPQIDSNNNLQASINNLFEYVVEVSDVDNDSFTFSLTDNPFGVQLIDHSSIAIVSYTPSDTDNFINCFDEEECFSFTIQTSDNGNPSLSASESFLIKVVSNDNTLPIITVLDIDNYNEDELITIYFNIDDDDINITDLTFLCIYSRLGSTNNQYHQVSSGNNVSDYKVTFQPFNNWNGEFEIKIIADDQSSFITYALTLDLGPVNDIPIISNYQNISFNEGDYDNITPYLRNIYLVDSDQNSFANENPFSFADIDYTLIWHGDNIDGVDSSENQNIFSEFSRNGSSNTIFNYFYAQDIDWYGTEYFEVIVDDGESGPVSRVFPVTIDNVNDAPELTDIEDQIINEDNNIILTIIANDIDSDNLFYTMTGNHASYLFNDNILTISPDDNYYGNLDLSINVSDGDLSTNDSFTLTILSINDLPYTEDLNSILNEDDTYHLINMNGTIIDDLCNSEILNASDNSTVCNCNDLQEGACDIEDINLSFKLHSNVSNGNLYLDVDNSIILNENDLLLNSKVYYNPASDFFGLDEFVYEVCDQELACSLGTVNLIINASNDIPSIDNEANSITISEDNISSLINIISSDIDGDELTYSIIDTPSAGLLFKDSENQNSFNLQDQIDGSMLYYTPNLNFNGEDSFSFRVSDGISSIEGVYNIIISPVNDNPIANEIEGSIETVEDTPLLISLSGSDVDEDTLQFIVVSLPSNGTITNDEGMQLEINSIISENANSDGYLTNLTYTPHLDWIGEDTFSFKINDMQEEDNSLSNIMEVNIIVSQINDTPILNCPNGNCNLLLSDINAIYEDCSPIESDSNIACDSVDGIIIEDLRVFYDSSNDICSSNHLWYDIDCYNSIDPEDFDFGIAIDMSSAIDDFDSNIGSWKYKKQGAEGYIDLTSSLATTCNFLLLDHMDELFFRPNDNYHTTEDIQTFPSIVFHAWDKTEYVNAGDLMNESCVNSLLNSSSFSESSITASVEILSVNDTPHSNIIDLDPSYKEFCPQQDNPSCNETGIYEILIEFADLLDSNDEIYSDDMFFYVSSTTISENSQQSLFSNIPFNINPYDPTNFINQSSADVIEKRGNELYLKLNLVEYANGSAEITIVGYDRENFDEGLSTEQTFTFVVEQVNNKISQFEIIPNIGLYEDYNDNIINNDIMLYQDNFTNDDDLYIKYPPYIYNNNIITVDYINADNFLAVQEFMIENPPNMGEIYFMWNRNLDTYLDYDIDEMLNAEPYNLYYRLEFIDSDNNIFVLKDSILENFTNLENAYTKIKFSKGPFKKYKDGDIYNPESIPNPEALIDTTGLTFYNWRIVADNYQTNSQDINTEYDFYNTKSELSENAYAINLIIPKFNYDFSINDIYPNYFDLYLSPVPTNFINSFSNNYELLTLNENSEIYIDYPNNTLDETLKADFLDFPNNEQNIFLVNDDINQFGPCVFFAPIENSVGNLNISKTEVNFNQVTPNVFNTVESSSQDFSVQFNPNNQFNMIIYEREYNEIMLNDSNLDILSNLFIIKANNIQASKAQINYILNSNLEDVSNVTFCRYDNGNIEKISSKINNGILSADIENFGSFLVIFDSISSDNEIPLQTSLLSCFPNPFNPSTSINYFLSKESDIRFKIFNVTGQVVFISDNISAKSGYNNYQWSALDNSGNLLPSGIYIVSMSSNNEFFTKKITLLK